MVGTKLSYLPRRYTSQKPQESGKGRKGRKGENEDKKEKMYVSTSFIMKQEEGGRERCAPGGAALASLLPSFLPFLVCGLE